MRFTLAALVPLLCGQVVGQPLAGLIACLGGLLVSIADVGGPYRQKAAAMGSALALVPLAGFAGTLAGVSPWTAIPAMFLCAFLVGLAGVYGNTPSTVSFVVLVAFLLLAALPGGLAEGSRRVILLLAGGAWAMVLSLWLWPLKPFFPVLRDVAAAYRALGNLAGRLGAEQPSGEWWTALTPARSAVVEAVAKGRESLVAIRTSRQGMSPTGQNVLVLIRHADRLYADLVALAEALPRLEGRPGVEHLREMLEDLRTKMTRAFEALAPAIERGGGTVGLEGLDELLEAIGSYVQALRHLPGTIADAETEGELRNLGMAVESAGRHLHVVAEATRRLGYVPSAAEELTEPEEPVDPRVLAGKLISHFNPHSLILRHALRLGVATAAAVAVYTFFELPRGAWITLTVAVILKPDFGGTRQRALERVAGTVIGAMIGGLIASLVRDPLPLSIALALASLMAFSQMALSYQRFVVFLTVFVVLLIDSLDPGGWGVAVVRVENTVIGGLMALMAGYLLLPKWVHQELPAQVAETIAANRRYLLPVMTALAGVRHPPGTIRQAREKAQIENANAAVAFQRLVSEDRSRHHRIEPFYSMINSNQRIMDAVVSLATRLTHLRVDGLERLALRLSGALEELEAAVREQRPARLDHAGLSAEIQEAEYLHHKEYLGIAGLVGRIADETLGIERALERMLGDRGQQGARESAHNRAALTGRKTA